MQHWKIDARLIAVESKSGALWPDFGLAMPMSREAGGQQFLFTTAGCRHFMQTPVGDYVIAYGVPKAGQ